MPTGRVASVILLVVSLIEVVHPQCASRPAPEPPPTTPQHYDEDYSYLLDPCNRSGAWWEIFKAISLSSSGKTNLSMGAETRFRYERYEYNYSVSPTLPVDEYLRYRLLPYANLTLPLGFRVFGQMQIAYGDRSEIVKNPFIDETGIEVLQALVDWRIHIGEAKRALIIFRCGHQVLVYGSGRFINAGPNIRTSFNGPLVSFESGHWRADVFWVRPILPKFGSFNDHADKQRQVWSFYATRTLASQPKTGFDLYYIGFVNNGAAFNQGKGRERRYTFGSRWFGSRGPWGWDIEADVQTGNFAGRNILAWGIAPQGQYTFRTLPLKPWLGIRWTILSGDRSKNDHHLGTFNAMFPQGGYFGEIGVIGPSNVIDLHQAAGIQLRRDVSLGVAAIFYWRESLGDGIYGIGGQLVRGDDGSHARYIGPQGDLTLGWAANRNIGFYGSYSILKPGRFITATGPTRTVHFASAHVQFQF